MINLYEVAETNKMISEENLDVRTITLGISLLDCIDSDLKKLNEKIYDKIYEAAKDLVRTGEEISREFGIPIVNKRISVTPIALAGGAACRSTEDYVSVAQTLDRVAKEVGVNFIGGYSALVSKGMTSADELLIRSIPMALSSQRESAVPSIWAPPGRGSIWTRSGSWEGSSVPLRSSQRKMIRWAARSW